MPRYFICRVCRQFCCACAALQADTAESVSCKQLLLATSRQPLYFVEVLILLLCSQFFCSLCLLEAVCADGKGGSPSNVFSTARAPMAAPSSSLYLNWLMYWTYAILICLLLGCSQYLPVTAKHSWRCLQSQQALMKFVKLESSARSFISSSGVVGLEGLQACGGSSSCRAPGAKRCAVYVNECGMTGLV